MKSLRPLIILVLMIAGVVLLAVSLVRKDIVTGAIALAISLILASIMKSEKKD